jgi:hypothetical protein
MCVCVRVRACVRACMCVWRTCVGGWVLVRVDSCVYMCECVCAPDTVWMWVGVRVRVCGVLVLAA